MYGYVISDLPALWDGPTQRVVTRLRGYSGTPLLLNWSLWFSHRSAKKEEQSCMA